MLVAVKRPDTPQVRAVIPPRKNCGRSDGNTSALHAASISNPGQRVWEDGKPVGREEGTPLDMYNVKNRYFLKTLEKAKLRRIRFHDLRHTFASLLIQNGESVAYIKDQLGHSSIKMTVDVYGHLVPGANRAAVNRLPSFSKAEFKAAQSL